jgi:hypothetical protein
MGGSFFGALGGLAVAVLAIIGLAGVAVSILMPIAIIVVGVALLAEGGAMLAYRSRAMHEGDGPHCHTEVCSGLSAEVLAGIAGIVLGVLALIGLSPPTLLAVSIVVFGTGSLLASVVACSATCCETDVAKEAVLAAVAAKAMIGLAVVILGILALVGLAGNTALNTQTLTLVALLVLGVAMGLAGFAIGGRLAGSVGSRK